MNTQKIHPIEDYILEHTIRRDYYAGGNLHNAYLTNDMDRASVVSGSTLLSNDTWRWKGWKAIRFED